MYGLSSLKWAFCIGGTQWLCADDTDVCTTALCYACSTVSRVHCTRSPFFVMLCRLSVIHWQFVCRAEHVADKSQPGTSR